jgi:hypothetical protein
MKCQPSSVTEVESVFHFERKICVLLGNAPELLRNQSVHLQARTGEARKQTDTRDELSMRGLSFEVTCFFELRCLIFQDEFTRHTSALGSTYPSL